MGSPVSAPDGDEEEEDDDADGATMTKKGTSASASPPLRRIGDSGGGADGGGGGGGHRPSKPPQQQNKRGGPSWTRTRLSPSALSLAVFASVLFTVGLFTSQPLIFISVPVVALLGFMILRSRRPGGGVEVSRTLERSQVQEKDGCRVGLRVTNTGERDIPVLQIRDLVPSELDGEATQNGFTLSLKAGETRELYYRVERRALSGSSPSGHSFSRCRTRRGWWRRMRRSRSPAPSWWCSQIRPAG